MVRLNLGCGAKASPGWLNCDIAALPGVDFRMDLPRGLPLASGSADYIAAIHVVQDLAWPSIAPALEELYRVLKPGGVLRLAVPDLDRAIDAYRAGDARYFYVPERDAQSVGAKLTTQIIWYGSVRTPCTFDFLEEWLHKAGFDEIVRQRFGTSRVPGLADLDNRERESLFVEAIKPA
ncbi:MAG TPA: methyltransferase domain-containing protein [Casimicrobiaceae bacterium]|jgi:predicted SAM-dependent methyltransferase